MRLNRWRIAAPLLAISVATTIGPGPTSAQARAAGRQSAAARQADPPPPGLPAEAARLYGWVKKPRPGELGWQRIPWLTDLREAIRLAEAEQRPLLLFVSGDDPLEKC